jgi:site-specific DNA recombinase
MTPRTRCAIYTRKSSEEGLEQAFNSLDAQREACEAFVKSQQHEGWQAIGTHYDDGGFSGGNVDRPALKRLMDDIHAGKVSVVVVYKVDRLTRSLADFAKLVEQFDKFNVSFVSAIKLLLQRRRECGWAVASRLATTCVIAIYRSTKRRPQPCARSSINSCG